MYDTICKRLLHTRDTIEGIDPSHPHPYALVPKLGSIADNCGVVYIVSLMYSLSCVTIESGVGGCI